MQRKANRGKAWRGLPEAMLAALVGLAMTIPTALAQAPERAAPSSSATPPPPSSQPPHQSSGTAPGEAGSTGWTGGIGGSHIGTSQDGPAPGSPNAHSETATGLDPIKPKQ